LALFLPVEITLANGLFAPITTRTVVYGSVLNIPNQEGNEALKILLRAYTRDVKQKSVFTELRNMSDQMAIRSVLIGQGYIYENHLNYLIDLDQSTESIWHNISKSIRKHIKTAQKKGAEILNVTDRQQMKISYQLIKKAFHRIRVPVADFSLFESAFDILVSCGMLKIFLVRAENCYISTRLILTYKGMIFDWYAGSDRYYASYYPEEFMIWHILKWGKDQGFHVFDFGGAGKPKEYYGPREFKSKWGGTLKDYGREIRVNAPIKLKLSKAGYQLLRKIHLSSLLSVCERRRKRC